jgi:signal transduction histidine kinase
MRRFVEALHPELAGSGESDLTEALVEPAPLPPKPPAAPPPVSHPSPAHPSLSDVVARIERRRAKRELRQPAAANGGAASASAEGPGLFRWECGPSGEIAWVEGAPRGPLIGRSIARAHDIEGDRIDEDVVRAFAMRAPFRDGSLVLAGEGLVAGEWKISGVPAFDPADGRFAGYRGIALRDAPAEARREPAEILSDPDSLRELVHEIKTPLNAIIGFAEIIDGQYLGPADRRYRERAAEIVSQARLLLAAIDDLDFAAKAHSGKAGGRVDLSDLLDRAAEQLRSVASGRKVELEIASGQRRATAVVEPEVADRLIFRLCTAVIETAEAGERLRLSVDQTGDQCRLSINRPAALRGLSDRQLIEAAAGEGGAAFSLRLVRGLARIAGGDLAMSPAGFTLVFPRG